MHHAVLRAYAVLAAVSSCCPPVQGRLPTRYSPVRHSVFRNPPKSHPKSLVRLACVKHAASVHPEPGSNSLIKCVWFGQNNYLAIHSLFTVLKVSSLKIKLFKNFQGCFTVQLSRFLSCFSVVSLPEQLWYHITAFSVCQQLFSTFLFLFIGAVLISEVCIRLFLCLCGVFRSDVLHNTTTFLGCQHLFLKFFKFFVFYILYLFFIHFRLFFLHLTMPLFLCLSPITPYLL